MGLLDSLIDLVSPNSLEDQRKRLEQGRSRTYIRGEQSRLPVSAPKAPARLPKATAQPSSTTLQIKDLGKQYRAGRVNQQDFNNRLNALTNQVNQDWRAGLDRIDSAMLNNPNELLTGYSLSGRKVEGAAGDLSRNVVRPLVGGLAETNWVRPIGAAAQLATQNRFGAGLANYGDTSNSTFSGRYDTNYGSKLIRGGAGLASDMAVTLAVPGGSWAVGAKHGLNEANDQFQGALNAGYGVGDAYKIAIPAGVTQGAISKYLTGKLGSNLKSNFTGNVTTNLIKRGAASFGTEAAEEGLQQLSSNAFRNLYDPNQGLTDGVVESALIGGILGGGTQVATDINRTGLSNVATDFQSTPVGKKMSSAQVNAINEDIGMLDRSDQDTEAAYRRGEITKPQRDSKLKRNAKQKDELIKLRAKINGKLGNSMAEINDSELEYLRSLSSREQSGNKDNTRPLVDTSLSNQNITQDPLESLKQEARKFETLPADVHPSLESKAVGLKRIAPDRVPHQQLTVKEGIEKLVESEKNSVGKRAESWVKGATDVDNLIKKYGDALPARTKSNLDKYPDLQKDYATYAWLKKYTYGGNLKLSGMKDQFVSNAERVGWNPTKESTYRASVDKKYKDLVAKDISKGYRYPDEVLNYDKSFKTAIDNRARYEKGFATSFSADDARIVFDEQNRVPVGLKRQDGKELTPAQKEEIVQGVVQTQRLLGIDINKLAKDERWIFAHLNGKNPFLTQNAAGQYRKHGDSASISLGGTESFIVRENGKNVTKKVNTTAAHEIGHALDLRLEGGLLDYRTLSDLKYSFKPTDGLGRSNKYWRKDTEVTARALEQYTAVKEGSTSFYDREGYWSKEIFDSKIKPAIEKAINDKYSDYKISSPANQSQPPKSTPTVGKNTATVESKTDEGTKVFRADKEGGFDPAKVTDRGISVTPSRKTANKLFMTQNRKLQELTISKDAKIMPFNEIPSNLYTEKASGELRYTPKSDYTEVVQLAKSKGYDGVDLRRFGENEIRIINPNVISASQAVKKPTLQDALEGRSTKINSDSQADQLIKQMSKGQVNPRTGEARIDRGRSLQEAQQQELVRQGTRPSLQSVAREPSSQPQFEPSLRVGEQTPTQQETQVPTSLLQSLDPEVRSQAERIAQKALKDQLPDYKTIRAVPDLESTYNNNLPPDILAAQANKTYPVGRKVGFIDYLRTPDRVLKKIGLEQEGKQMRQAHQNYLTEIPKQLQKINDWYNAVGKSQESSEKIFKWLDGDKSIALNSSEAKVASEIKTYLSKWADRLGLPQDKRVTNYITHIFEDSLIEKEFDPEFEKLMQDRLPGSVYDPFTEQRLGARGYKEDVFAALDAYAKRGTRKANMDKALYDLKNKGEGLDQTAWDYVKKFADRVNMRPTDIDKLVDNQIKQVVGYKFGSRPVNKITRGIRNATYRATLGLNIGSAVRNLTQGVNTFGELGSKWTGVGYTKAVTDLFSRSSELKDVGVLSDSFIEDRHTSAMKSAAQKFDKALWVFFDTAEKINRGAAYYGAKQRALSQGKNVEQAIAEGIETARNTQFTFGAVDNPVALNSDIVRTIAQFQSFNIKQTEFIAEAVKNKEFAKLARMSAASWVMVATLGQVLGYEPEDFIPFSSELSGDPRIGKTPFFQALGTAAQMATGNNKDSYGNEISTKDRLKELAGDVATASLPAFVQGRKTVTGLDDALTGFSDSKTGRVRYPIDDTTANKIKAGVFGGYTLQDAQEYRDKERSPLSDNQSEQFRALPRDKQRPYYDRLMTERALNKEAEEAGLNSQQTKSELAERIGGSYENYLDAFDLDSTSRDPDTIAKMYVKGTGYEGLPKEVFNQYLKENKLKRSDIEYAVDAQKSTDDKLQAFSTMKFKNRNELLGYLQQGRTKSIDGYYRANEKFLRTLRDNGTINNNELYGLLNTIDGKYQTSSRSSSGSSSGGSTRGKYDYKLFGGTYGTSLLSRRKQLRDLLESIA